MFSELALAVADADLYLRKPDDPSDEGPHRRPLLGAQRTVREVERLADAVEQLPDNTPALALVDGALAFWDLQRGNYPRYVADVLIAERLQNALARRRAASTDRRPMAVAAYTSRPRTTEVAGALRLMLCEQGDADCNRLCTARRSELEPCDGAAGFRDRELFELLLGPVRRSPLYRSNHLAARFALGLATGQEGATSTTSTAAPRSPASRRPTGWPTTPSCSLSATPCWSNSASWVWAIRWPSPRPTSRPSSPATTGRSSAA